MSRVTADFPSPPADVFDVLATPATYPAWLVGCQEIRAVDTDWPALGSRFHHRVGLAPQVTVDDSSGVVDIDPPHRLVLDVRFRPAGRGRVTFELSPDGTGTHLEYEEVPVGRLAPLAPVFHPLTHHRNQASVRRLADYLRSRAGRPPT